MSTTRTIEPNPRFMEPQSVLQTAAMAAGNDTTLSYVWWNYNRLSSFMVFLHFADFQDTQKRQFDIYFNGNRLGNNKPYSPPYLVASCVYNSEWYSTSDGKYTITLTATAASVLPPMLNGIEFYTLISLGSQTTFPKDCEL